jgi:hypothetical protein
VTPQEITTRPITFTRDELSAMRELRARVRPGQDPGSRRELARLRFARWLYHTGRLQS